VVLVTREDGEFKLRLLDGVGTVESNEHLAACSDCLAELGLPAADGAPFDIAAFFQGRGRNVTEPEPPVRGDTARLRALREG
jgi:hypothetical protein